MVLSGLAFMTGMEQRFNAPMAEVLLELKEDESCRRVPVMTWVGLENYERFFEKTPEILSV